MFKENLNIIVFLIIITAIMVVSSILTIFIVPNYFTEYTRIINLMVWMVLFVLSAPVENEHARFKGKYDKVKTVLIVVVIYYMIYFFLGIFYGYQKSPYSMAFLSVLKNLVFVVGISSLKEFVRAKLINANKDFKSYIFITIAFVLINLDFNNFFDNFTSVENIFKFIVSNLLPQIAISCVCTYLAKTGGVLLVYAYRLPIMLVTVLLPIFPDVDYFLASVMEVLVALIIFILINYEHTIKITRLTRGEKEEINPKKSVLSIIFVIVLVVFIAGLLPFKPVAVMSNSMVPYFSRGYVVIVKKLDKEDIKKLEVGDILEYQLDKSMILHRIIEIEQDGDGNLLFTTQGDNNASPDLEKVKEEQVVGIIKFKIPYLGYPSVWFSELLLKKNSNIRT